MNCQETPGQEINHAEADLDRLVEQHQLTPEQETEPEQYGEETSEDMCYSYSAPVEGQYLEGCIDECRSFQTLQEAEDHCDQILDCGGVTHSLYGEGQAWHDGVGPYEVRLGPALKASQDGDISWVRIEVADSDNARRGRAPPPSFQSASCHVPIALRPHPVPPLVPAPALSPPQSLVARPANPPSRRSRAAAAPVQRGGDGDGLRLRRMERRPRRVPRPGARTARGGGGGGTPAPLSVAAAPKSNPPPQHPTHKNTKNKAQQKQKI